MSASPQALVAREEWISVVDGHVLNAASSSGNHKAGVASSEVERGDAAECEFNFLYFEFSE